MWQILPSISYKEVQLNKRKQMANYIATSRSNYFKVKDTEKFEDFCGEIGVEMITQEDLVGFLCNLDDCGSLPSSIYNEETDDHDEIDLAQEVAKHLVKGEVAVFMESGHEKFRYVTGSASAVNWKGEEVFFNLEDIYERANKELGGEHVTRAEY